MYALDKCMSDVHCPICLTISCNNNISNENEHKCSRMLYICVRGVMDVVFSVCIVTRVAVGACVWVV